MKTKQIFPFILFVIINLCLLYCFGCDNDDIEGIDQTSEQQITKTNKMKTKQIFLVILVTIFSISLISCSSDDDIKGIDQTNNQTYEQQLKLINGTWNLQEINISEVQTNSKEGDKLVENFIKRQNENIKLSLDPYFNLRTTIEPYNGGYDDYNYLKSKDKLFFKGEISPFQLDEKSLIVSHLESVTDLTIFVKQDAKNNDETIPEDFKIQKAVFIYKYIR